MAQKLTYFLEKQWYPYIYGSLFITYKSTQFLPSFSFVIAISCFAVYCFFSHILFFLIRKTHNIRYAGVIVMMCWFSILHIAGIAQFFGYPYANIPSTFYIAFYTVFVIAAIIINRRLKKLSFKYAYTFSRMSNIYLCIMLLILIGNIFIFTGKMEITRQQTPVASKQMSRHNDIVWILLDEYASSEILVNQFNFNNSLDTELTQRNFFVFDSMQSRFNNTLFSVNSIFNMDDSIQPSNFYSCVRLLKQSKWIPRMESSGYNFINLGLFDIGMHKKLANRSGYPQDYYDQLFSGTLFNMLSNKFIYTSAKSDEYNKLVFHKLMDTLSTPSDQPRFIWAHLGIPHQPFCRDHNGKLLPDEEYSDVDSILIKKRYKDYLAYGNKLITNLLETKNLTDKIVIISGDHGPRYSFLQDSKRCSKSPYAAIYLPGYYNIEKIKKVRYISQFPFLIDDFLHM